MNSPSPHTPWQDAVILIAGERTLLGQALARWFIAHGLEKNLLPAPADLCNREKTAAYFAQHPPGCVFLAAGKSGGIAFNQSHPADLMMDNLLIATNVIEAAHVYQSRKLLYLASSCCYPKLCSQPMAVDQLMTGRLEPTNEPYALAKLAGIGMCQAHRQQHGSPFIVGIPANSYGPGDSFDPENAHVIGALIRRIHDAKAAGQPEVVIWGTGTPRREFIYIDDLADACIKVMSEYDSEVPINLGSGQDFSIRELAETIGEVVGFDGKLRFDASRPDGMPFKSLDSTPLRAMGWRPATSLRDGLTETYRWFKSQTV
jgi:GDP-L-fucose synthase